MVKPANFIINTNHATLKNDSSTIVTVTFAGSQNIPASVTAAGSTLQATTDVVIAQIGSITRTQIASSKDSTKFRATRVLNFTRTGTVLSNPAVYNAITFAYRLNATTIRCVYHVLNPYSEILTTEAANETITFDITTFLPPFV